MMIPRWILIAEVVALAYLVAIAVTPPGPKRNRRLWICTVLTAAIVGGLIAHSCFR